MHICTSWKSRPPSLSLELCFFTGASSLWNQQTQTGQFPNYAACSGMLRHVLSQKQSMHFPLVLDPHCFPIAEYLRSLALHEIWGLGCPPSALHPPISKMPFSSKLLIVSTLANPAESPLSSYQRLSHFFYPVCLPGHTLLPLFSGHGLLAFSASLSGFMLLAGLCSFSYWSLQGQSLWTICLLIHPFPVT